MAINAAKVEFGMLHFSECVAVMAIADPEWSIFPMAAVWVSQGEDWMLENSARKPIRAFYCKLVVIVIEIRLQGDVAYDYGWHELALTPKDGGQPTHRRDRLCDICGEQRRKWKLRMYMDNQDVADPFEAEHTLGLGAQS